MNLKQKRIDAGLTREELAERVGCHKQQIYNFEKGTSPVPIKYAKKMAKALGVSKEEINIALAQIKLDRYFKKDS